MGTGKYKDYAQNAAAAAAAGAEIVTVALRRVKTSTDPSQPMLVDYVKPDRFTFLPNTAGCFTGEEAVRTLRLAREAGGWDLVKLEVLSNTKHLLPDMEETLRALKLLIAEGFQVMVYCSDDPVYARKLEDAGRGGDHAGGGARSARGPRHPEPAEPRPDRRTVEGAGAGGRRRRHRARPTRCWPWRLGCDAVLMNTAIAEAKDPIRMARAMKHAVIAGREAYLAPGRMPKRTYADPSSPLSGLI